MTVDISKRIKALRTEINSGDLDSDGVRAYLIQLETLLSKPTKTLYIDADGLIYKAAYSPLITNTIDKIESGTFIGVPVEDVPNDLELMFNDIVNNVVDACRYESLMGNMITFKDYVLVYTPSTNFRYAIYPQYKYRRAEKEQSSELLALKSIVKPKGLIVKGVEADDVVAHYGRRGNPVASGDKDIVKGVEGNNYYYYDMSVVKTTKEDAERFILLQSIAGDGADDIPGIKGVGMKTKLLPENATFKDVIEIYESKGLTKEDAILTRQLVGLDQWRGKRRGLKIWQAF